MSNGLEPWVSGLLSSEFLRDWKNGDCLQVCVMRGAAEATPSPWVVVAVCRWHTQRLFMPLHVSDSRLYFRIRAAVSHQALLWRDLLGFHDGCTEIAGSPIELLQKQWIVGRSPWGVQCLQRTVAWWSLGWHSLSTQGLRWLADEL